MKRRAITRIGFGAVAFATVAFAVGLGAQPFKPVPASKCSLPVDSTISLEFPIGSKPATVELKSSSSNVPTVETSEQSPKDRAMDTNFVSLEQSGSFGGKTIDSRLAPNVRSRGRVEKVQQAGPGVFRRGHHTFNLFLQYTINKGKADEAVLANKVPIKIEADIDSTSPTGAVYRMTGQPVPLFDANNRRAGVLHSLENRVLRP